MENSMDLIEQFKKEQMEAALLQEIKAEKLRKAFVEDYPISEINSMSLDEYLIAKDGYGNPDSFCRRLLYQLKLVSSLGRTYNNAFGIYYNAGMQIELYSTYQKMFGNNFDAAFEFIKNEITKLLIYADKDDYPGIIECKISSAIKYKLLNVYYPDKFVPVCTKDRMDDFCNCLGLVFSTKEDMLYKNFALREWKESVSETENLSNYIFMLFLVWAVDKKVKVSKSVFRKDEEIAKAKEIDEEVDRLNLVGETREAVINVRVNQGEFRNRLLQRYNRCCLCGVDNPELLVASHIKPWAKSKPEEKLDVNNGFLMCPNHDRLFDKGWISFDDEGNIVIAN